MSMMNPTDARKRTARAANRPMVKWSTDYDHMTTDEKMQISNTAAALATHYARLSAYLSRRHAGGKHDDAVKAQNRTASRVRQALGYTYKDAPITF